MTDSIITFINYLRKKDLVEDVDFLKKASEFMYQKLIDLEAEEVIGAGRYERTPKRQTYRNGTRERQLETRVGEITVGVPKRRMATYAMQVLMMKEQFEHQGPASIVLPTELIVRESCSACLNKSG